MKQLGEFTLTVLVDDKAGKGPERAEHGFSIWIETEKARILFDTGQGPAARDNARLLGIDLGRADAIVISHGHYDHTGGLQYILADCPKARLFLHPDAMNPRYSRSMEGGVRAIGYPHGAEELSAGRSGGVVWTRTTTYITPSIFVTGEIPRATPPEAPEGRFFLDRECRIPDPIADDQALVIDADTGAVVILGCSHSGVWNTLSYALRKSRSGILRALIGGMHLSHTPEEVIAGLADRLTAFHPGLVCPCHCTGQRAKEVLERMFPKVYREGSTGVRLAFE